MLSKALMQPRQLPPWTLAAGMGQSMVPAMQL